MSLSGDLQMLTMEPGPLHSAMADTLLKEISGYYREISTIKQLTEELDRIYAKGSTWKITKQELNDALARTDLPSDEIKPFVHIDSSKAYTRNLVSTDHKNYTLLMLCWNPYQESCIHNHPCDGCFIKPLAGEIQETIYDTIDSTSEIRQRCVNSYRQGEVSYMDDFVGLHKVGNPNSKDCAVTLHLYTPPFKSCKVWSDDGVGQLDKYETRDVCCDTYYNKFKFMFNM